MADKTQAIIFEMKARDSASSVFRQTRQQVDQLAKSAGKIQPLDLKPLRPRFEFDEEGVRKQMAHIIHDMREEARRNKITIEAETRLFGGPRTTAGGGGRGGGGAGESEGGVHGLLGDIKGGFGRGSTFKEITEVLAGGGVIAGLTIGAGLLKEWATSASDLQHELHEGKINSGQMVEKLIGGIPVLGQIFQAGRAIRELLTEEEAKAREITEQAKFLNEAMDHRAEAIKRGNEAHQETLDILKQIRQESERAGLKGPAAEQVAAAQEEENRREEANRAAKKQHDDEIAANKAALEAARKKEHDTRPVTPGAGERVIEEDLKARQAAHATALNALRILEDQQKKNLEQIEKDKQDKLAAIAAVGGKQRQVELAQAQAEEAAQWRESQRRIADSDSEAKEAALRQIGDTAAAERERLNRELDHTLRDISDRREKALAEHPENTLNILAHSGAETQAAKEQHTAQVGQAEQDAALDKQQKSADIAGKLAAIRKEAFGEEAAAGDDNVKREYQILQITEAALQKHAEIAKLREQVGVTAEQKAAADEADAEVERAKAAKIKALQKEDSTIRLIAGQYGTGLTGVAQSALTGGTGPSVAEMAQQRQEQHRAEIAQEAARQREQLEREHQTRIAAIIAEAQQRQQQPTGTNEAAVRTQVNTVTPAGTDRGQDDQREASLSLKQMLDLAKRQFDVLVDMARDIRDQNQPQPVQVFNG